jgi:fatty acid desaturase
METLLFISLIPLVLYAYWFLWLILGQKVFKRIKWKSYLKPRK